MRLSIKRAAILTAVTLAVATGCATSDEGDTSLDAAIPTTIPGGTTLSISVNTTRVALEASGEKLPFTVSDWPNVSGGPDVIQAFRGGSLELASNAGIPPIQAHATDLDTKIVAVKIRNIPTYKIATAPGSNINTLADLRGKKIAFSPGQAQGVVVLRTLQEQGIPLDQVTLVELKSTEFNAALQGKQVDAAPAGGTTIAKYLDEYGAEGAKALDTPAVDLLSVLWAPTSVLKDSGKLAAVNAFVTAWAKGEVWAWENRDAWIDAYYVKDQGLTREQAEVVLQDVPKPYFPDNWDAAVKWEQETIDLVTASGWFGTSFNADELFDRRFEKVAADAVAEQYRKES